MVTVLAAAITAAAAITGSLGALVLNTRRDERNHRNDHRRHAYALLLESAHKLLYDLTQAAAETEAGTMPNPATAQVPRSAAALDRTAIPVIITGSDAAAATAERLTRAAHQTVTTGDDQPLRKAIYAFSYAARDDLTRRETPRWWNPRALRTPRPLGQPWDQ